MKLYNIKTIMSTPIVQFSSDTENFQRKALQLYLAITIPFMVLTFGARGGLYMLAKRSDARKQEQKQTRVDSWMSVV
jgi:RsiW-degrading membrane proteinase PrsW (M82 family)